MKPTWRFYPRRRRFLQRGAAALVGPLLITPRTIAQTRTLYINSTDVGAEFRERAAKEGLPAALKWRKGQFED